MAEPERNADETSSGAGPGKTGPGKKSGALGDYVKAESLIQLAIALPAGCLIGWLAGDWADRRFHQQWIGVTGILLGAAAGFMQIYKTAARFLKDGRKGS